MSLDSFQWGGLKAGEGAKNFVEVGGDGHDAEAGTLDEREIGEAFVGFDGGERDGGFCGLDWREIDDGCFGFCFVVEAWLRGVFVGGLGDFREADDGFCVACVVDQRAVAEFHGSQKDAGLRIGDACPDAGSVAEEIGEGEVGGLGFEQESGHDSAPSFA